MTDHIDQRKINPCPSPGCYELLVNEVMPVMVGLAGQGSGYRGANKVHNVPGSLDVVPGWGVVESRRSQGVKWTDGATIAAQNDDLTFFLFSCRR